MSAATIYELVGYLASLLIVISLTMKSIFKLRLIGLAGSVTFLVYGILIEAYPIALTNVVIIVIHGYFLRQLLWRRSEVFTTLHVNKDSAYLAYFCNFHAADIERYIPGFAYEPSDDQIRVFILRDLVPAGLFIADRCADGALDVQLDFVIPAYRDFKIGKYLYSRDSKVFTDLGCDRVLSTAATKAHIDYLVKMGFTPDGEPGVYSLDVGQLRAA